jgi:hypothetical protein
MGRGPINSTIGVVPNLGSFSTYLASISAMASDCSAFMAVSGGDFGSCASIITPLYSGSAKRLPNAHGICVPAMERPPAPQSFERRHRRFVSLSASNSRVRASSTILGRSRERAAARRTGPWARSQQRPRRARSHGRSRPSRTGSRARCRKRRVTTGSRTGAEGSWADRNSHIAGSVARGSQRKRIDDKVQKGSGVSSSACRVARGVGRQESPCARNSLCGPTTVSRRKSVGDRGIGEAPDPRPDSELCSSPSPVSPGSLASAASIRSASTPSGRGE